MHTTATVDIVRSERKLSVIDTERSSPPQGLLLPGTFGLDPKVYDACRPGLRRVALRTRSIIRLDARRSLVTGNIAVVANGNNFDRVCGNP